MKGNFFRLISIKLFGKRTGKSVHSIQAAPATSDKRGARGRTSGSLTRARQKTLAKDRSPFTLNAWFANGVKGEHEPENSHVA